MPQKNLAVEMLRKLLQGELRMRRRKNVVQARSFAEMLEQTIRRYQNRAIEAAQVIEELIALAKDMREANARGEVLGLSEDELAFYDALETNDSAVKVLGDETLRTIARELVEDRSRERDDRLDPARERARSAPRAREAHPSQVRLSTRQAGEGDSDGAGTGGPAFRRMGSRVNRARTSTRSQQIYSQPLSGSTVAPALAPRRVRHGRTPACLRRPAPRSPAPRRARCRGQRRSGRRAPRAG